MALSRNDRLQLFLVLLVIGVGAATGTFLFFHAVRNVQQIPLRVEVRPLNSSRTNATDRLYFRSIPPGGQGIRELLLENHGNDTTLMHLTLSGETAAWATPDHRFVVLSGEEYRALNIRIRVPPTTLRGNYTIMVDVVAYALG